MGARYLITGGTGSFGKRMLSELLLDENNDITILSRDEKKQEELRFEFRNNRIKFLLGDTRDPKICAEACKNIDYVFQAAALKQVPSCEIHPFEATKTNVIGTQNIVSAATEAEVKSVVVLSTDKAVYPINAMGISKAMAEKIAVAQARKNISLGSKTRISVTRYGNVMSSRGSVIPLFLDKISKNEKLTVTNWDMTRFMMSLWDSVDLVKFAFKNGTGGETFVRKSPGATIKTLVAALELHFEKKLPAIEIGIRHGEKIHETLLSQEEAMTAHDLGDYFMVPPDLRDINYTNGASNLIVDPSRGPYTSNSTYMLSAQELHKILIDQGIVV